MKLGATEAAREIDAIGTAISARIKDLVGVTATVRLVNAGTMERSLGKAKRVVDLR